MQTVFTSYLRKLFQSQPDLMTPVAFRTGRKLKNRFVLAPLTNLQSHEDGTLSDEEYRWLTMRAKGGFALTMTCGAHIEELGKGFSGQLGVFSDDQIDGLSRLATGIKEHDSLAIVQLFHGGIRCPPDLIGTSPVGPTAHEKFGNRALSNAEVKSLIEQFVGAARRCEKAGFQGVELHGAHGYLLGQFMHPEINHRTDEYGGDIDGRWRVLFEVIDGIRSACSSDFLVGVRLSPEKFAVLSEVLPMAEKLMMSGSVDFLDMSLWDLFKEPDDEGFQGRSLVEHFAKLKRGKTLLGAAGNIRTPDAAERALKSRLDWVMLGRAAILHHDFPEQYANDQSFKPVETPVDRKYLRREGVSNAFFQYLATTWPEFAK